MFVAHMLQNTRFHGDSIQYPSRMELGKCIQSVVPRSVNLSLDSRQRDASTRNTRPNIAKKLQSSSYLYIFNHTSQNSLPLLRKVTEGSKTYLFLVSTLSNTIIDEDCRRRRRLERFNRRKKGLEH